MTVENDNANRIARLEVRVDRFETTIERIFQSLEEIKIQNASNKCPSPGACIGLGKELEHAVTMMNATMLRVERLELKLIDMERLAITESRKVEAEFHKIERQKAWVLGAWSVVAFLASLVGALAVIAIKYFIDKA